MSIKYKILLDNPYHICYTYLAQKSIYAGMAELADALDSGSSEGSLIQVQVLLPAPKQQNSNLLPIGEAFGFLLFKFFISIQKLVYTFQVRFSYEKDIFFIVNSI